MPCAPALPDPPPAAHPKRSVASSAASRILEAFLITGLLSSLAWPTACESSGLRTGSPGRFYYAGAEFERRYVESTAFTHVVFERVDCTQVDDRAFPVFLDGDGISWIRDGRVSEDPTPERAIGLELLAADGGCGLYVSRPCSFGTVSTDAACEPAVWTVDRYGERVVESIREVVERVTPIGRPLDLIGYSGGGLIASQLARRMPRVAALVTLGANLDLPRWVELHGYTPSLVRRSLPSPFPLRAELIQLHVFGSRDATSPARIADAVFRVDPRAERLVIEGADHTCCWAAEWPAIRVHLQQRIARSARSRTSSSLR